MKLKTSEVIYRDDLYPRLNSDPTTVQKYAEDLSVLPPILVNQHNEIIDGFHRWSAHRTKEAETIAVIVEETKSDNHLLSRAIETNASHGLQLSNKDKKSMAIRLYNNGTGNSKADIAKTLSVSEKSIARYLTDVDKNLRAERKERIMAMYLACYTQDEIAAAVGVPRKTVADSIDSLANIDNCLKSPKLSAEYNDDFDIPLYNVWTFAKKTNEVSHFGNSEVRIVDNLLYLYTNPFDIVVDPFAGGGSTIDICKKRLRRYHVSDRKPIVARESDIRKHDMLDGVPELNNRWSDVSLAYLDPPYWKQAEGEYSYDVADLANQDLTEFTENMIAIVNGLSAKMKSGSHIAMIIQPTQWRANDKQFTDHVFDICAGAENVAVENRIQVPYSTQQCMPQQVNWAKENKQLLVLSREVVIWRVM